MNPSRPWPSAAILYLFLMLPAAAGAQDAPPTDPFDLPAPPNLAPLEEERSRMCVDGHALLDSVIARLQPLEARAERLVSLFEAASLEDPDRVESFDPDDELEAAVAAWFELDARLWNDYQEQGNEEILERRSEARDEILERLGEAYEENALEIEALTEADEAVGEAIRRCEGTILLRDVVESTCGESDTSVCQALRAGEPTTRFRFVDEAEQLWDVEAVRPWFMPRSIGMTPAGDLQGGRTAVSARRGNGSVLLSLETLVVDRSTLSEEENREYDERLDALDFEFGHPDLNISPVVGIQVDLPGRLADESAWVVHFGVMPETADDVVHVLPAEDDGRASALIPLTPQIVNGLLGEKPLRLTAIGEATSGDAAPLGGRPLWALEFAELLRREAVNQLVTYWSTGDFSDDLLELVPPTTP